MPLGGDVPEASPEAVAAGAEPVVALVELSDLDPPVQAASLVLPELHPAVLADFRQYLQHRWRIIALAVHAPDLPREVEQRPIRIVEYFPLGAP